MWGNNPACLRVQAQLQRRARTTQQAAEGDKRNNGDDRQSAETKLGNSADLRVENDKEVEGSEEACGALDEEKSDVNTNGANDNTEPVNCADSSEHLFDETTLSTTIDDNDDTIITLPEDEDSEKSDGAKSFLISPEPSPEKLIENGEGRSDRNENVLEDEAGECTNSSSTNSSHSSNPLSTCEESSASNSLKSEESKFDISLCVCTSALNSASVGCLDQLL